MQARRSILFLNRFYWPDVAATGQMLTDLAEGLAELGWEVTVVASRTRYGGAGRELPREELHRGVRILRVSTTGFGRGSMLGRIADYLTYVLGAFLLLLRVPRPQVVVPMTDPPLIVGPALLAARWRGFRTVYWLQDLYPHLAAKLGVLSEQGLVYRLLAAVTRRLHRRCDRIVALGPRMAEEVIAAGGDPERTIYVHNWADDDAIYPVAPEENPFVRQHGLQGRFVVLYSGNAGRAHTFGAVLEAARRLRDDPEVLFLFIGGGRQLPVIQATAERLGLHNVRVLDYVARDQLAYSLSAASCTLVTESPDVAGLLVPSKTYGILASGRPLLFVGDPDTDVARIVDETGCGMVISPEDADGVVAAIRTLQTAPETRHRMGARARRAADEVYSRRAAVTRWAAVADSLLDSSGAPGERPLASAPLPASVAPPALASSPRGERWS